MCGVRVGCVWGGEGRVCVGGEGGVCGCGWLAEDITTSTGY